MVCTRETSIGGRVFAVSALKNLHFMFTPRLLLKGPRTPCQPTLGSARFGSVGGFWSCFAVWGDNPRRDKLDPIVR